ncbi:alpha/beta hydrolase family protein, partial [candidate division KSB1 bacterium]
SGDKKKIIERHLFSSYSPGGKYLLYFKNNHWWTFDIEKDTHTNITMDIPARFNNYTRIAGTEQNGAFGSGMWAEDDKWVLLYDRYDIYRVYPDGNKFERLTFGNDDKIRYRLVRLDYEEDALDPKKPIYLSVYGDFTKESGYSRLDKGDKITELIYEPRSISRLSKADDADNFILTKQKADESPNYYCLDSNFQNPVQLTDSNPQQKDYHWGRTELIAYKNEHGEELQGRLLYPANYQPGKKYPMLVYIYELRSQSLHSYTMPSERSAYNQRRYSSEGYFVYEPDIVYRLSDPGVSAVECVVPAVEEVLKTGMIDRDKIGLMGHSWEAYQTAFIITQTDLFSAGVAGAPLTNMISMYNSVYWNSGTPDAVIFETSQGRFPKPYWEDWDKFVENSPIFNVQNTNTPLLVEFGTDDGAVDFNQGVELYNTMRRMEKTYVMLVYEGENHGLAKKENQIDYGNRANDWFRHYLLGEEPAKWITDGVPYLEKPSEKAKKKK